MLFRSLHYAHWVPSGSHNRSESRETPHFDFIASESSRGISELSRNSDIPIINGIITTNTAQHALDRSQPEGKNKGWEAMEAALQTISVYDSMRADSTC